MDEDHKTQVTQLINRITSLRAGHAETIKAWKSEGEELKKERDRYRASTAKLREDQTKLHHQLALLQSNYDNIESQLADMQRAAREGKLKRTPSPEPTEYNGFFQRMNNTVFKSTASVSTQTLESTATALNPNIMYSNVRTWPQRSVSQSSVAIQTEPPIQREQGVDARPPAPPRIHRPVPRNVNKTIGGGPSRQPTSTEAIAVRLVAKDPNSTPCNDPFPDFSSPVHDPVESRSKRVRDPEQPNSSQESASSQLTNNMTDNTPKPPTKRPRVGLDPIDFHSLWTNIIDREAFEDCEDGPSGGDTLHKPNIVAIATKPRSGINQESLALSEPSYPEDSIYAPTTNKWNIVDDFDFSSQDIASDPSSGDEWTPKSEPKRSYKRKSYPKRAVNAQRKSAFSSRRRFYNPFNTGHGHVVECE